MPFWTARPDPREESRHGHVPAPAAHGVDVPWEPLTVPATRQRRHHRSRHCPHQITVDDLLYTAALTETEQAKTAQAAQAEQLAPPGQTAPLPALGTSSTAACRERPPTAASAVVVERDRRPWLLGSALFVASILAGTWALSSWPNPAIDDLLPPPDATLYGATGRLPEADPEADPSALVPGPAQDVSSASLSARGGSFPAAGGIPTTVLNAYRDAETRLGDIAPRCRLPWSLLAGIGKVESDHARRGAVDAAGTTRSPIIGPVLDGSAGNAAITDTDNGALDGDTRWDRAVGPSQFIPSSWELYGADGNNDGRADPHNVFDAAVGAGRYLCAGGLHLNDPNDLNTAVFRYNHSQTYVATVLAWARAYAAGAATLPDSRPTTPPAGEPAASTSRPTPRRTDDAPTTGRRSPHSDDPKNHDPDDSSNSSDSSDSASKNAEAPDTSRSPDRTRPPQALPRAGGAATAGPAAPTRPDGAASPVTAGPHYPVSADSSSHVAGAPRVTTVIPVPPADPTIGAPPAATTTPSPTPTAHPHRTGGPTTRRAPTAPSPSLSSSTASSAPVSAILAVDLSPTPDHSTLPRSGPGIGSGVGAGTGPGRSPAPHDNPRAVDQQIGDRAEDSAFDTAAGDFASHVNNHGGPGLVEAAPQPRIVAGPDGRDALSFVLPGGGKRAEVRPRVPVNREGDELWVRYQTALWNVPVDTDRWQLILQWHHQGNIGSPPIAVEVGRGQLRLAHQGRHQQSLGPISPDEHLDLMLHVRFSRDPARGQVDIWRGGQQVLAGYHPPGGTLLDTSNYLKMGLYRDPAISQDSAMTVTRLRQGPTRTAIANPLGPDTNSSADLNTDPRSAAGTDTGTTP